MTPIKPSPFSNLIVDTLPQIDPKATMQKPVDQAAFLESLATAFKSSGWVVPKTVGDVASKASNAVTTAQASTPSAPVTLSLQSQLQTAASQSGPGLATPKPDSSVTQLLKALGLG